MRPLWWIARPPSSRYDARRATKQSLRFHRTGHPQPGLGLRDEVDRDVARARDRARAGIASRQRELDASGAAADDGDGG